jgi:hypothetical protein
VTSHPSAALVLSVFVRAFRTPDLRKKLLFTGDALVIGRPVAVFTVAAA